MKQSLDLRHSQKLAMTPQMQQAIRLLQMSSIELNEEIQLAHETNPLLELVDDAELANDTGVSETANDFDETDSMDGSLSYDSDSITRLEFEGAEGDQTPSWEDMQSFTPVDQRKVRTDTSYTSDGGESIDYLMQLPEEQLTLRETLANQAIFLFADEVQRRIAHHIIQNINEAGYLDVELGEIQAQLADQHNVSIEDIEAVLVVIQKLEPAGVAARSAQECLRLQLLSRDPGTPGYVTACTIVDNHLQLLGSRDYLKLRKLLQVSELELGIAVEMITHLNPHPGYSFGNSRVDYIVPDIIVEKKEGNWLARHNTQALPRLTINRDYQRLISKGTGQSFGGMKEQLQNARWLLNNIEKRHQTILSVAREIVEKQQSFFHHGLEKLKPLTLSDISTPLGIHESTVSRATTGKYLLAPQGIFELKYFFSSQLSGNNGEAVSSRAIQTRIKTIVENENPRKPTSDEKICEILAHSGLKIARRTVAKYRELLNIPSSSKRKRL